MSRICDLRQKEVINIADGCRLGYPCDVEIDDEKGRVRKLIIPGPAKVLGMFGREQEYCVQWDCIRQIGPDVILVEVETGKVLSDCEF